ncbi:MAG TPA: DNA repair protein RecN, partial [Hyphomonas sp.]|nr:DNA repair protein RecN [Hyphomonas sp.]
GFGPLRKVASGGELARVSLALKCALAEAGSAGTLIFDEADQGVGGAVAAAIGERLTRLAGARQVLAITHSPQVAAAADAHWLVEKNGRAGETRLCALEASARREEIARMLSGAEITDEARAAAGRLMEDA